MEPPVSYVTLVEFRLRAENDCRNAEYRSAVSKCLNNVYRQNSDEQSFIMIKVCPPKTVLRPNDPQGLVLTKHCFFLQTMLSYSNILMLLTSHLDMGQQRCMGLRICQDQGESQ